MADIIRARYEVVEIVGRGGQGEVLHAIDRQHDRHVAIKIYRLAPDIDLTTVLVEARVLFTLKPHPALPMIREDFLEPDAYYIVMDWIEGTNLSEILAERGGEGLPFSQVLPYVADVADALDHLHRHDPPIVHQDVKPSNLILSPSGDVKLVDFGIASWKLQTGSLGSQGYIAPEIVAGEPPTPATDVYSLGATAVTLLTGSAPQLGRALSVPGAGRAASRRIRHALGRALALDPERRPTSAARWAHSLRPPLRRAVAPKTPRGKALTVLGAAATLGSLAVIAGGVMTPPPRETTRLVTPKPVSGPAVGANDPITIPVGPAHAFAIDERGRQIFVAEASENRLSVWAPNGVLKENVALRAPAYSLVQDAERGVVYAIHGPGALGISVIDARSHRVRYEPLDERITVVPEAGVALYGDLEVSVLTLPRLEPTGSHIDLPDFDDGDRGGSLGALVSRVVTNQDGDLLTCGAVGRSTISILTEPPAVVEARRAEDAPEGFCSDLVLDERGRAHVFSFRGDEANYVELRRNPGVLTLVDVKKGTVLRETPIPATASTSMLALDVDHSRLYIRARDRVLIAHSDTHRLLGELRYAARPDSFALEVDGSLWVLDRDDDALKRIPESYLRSAEERGMPTSTDLAGAPGSGVVDGVFTGMTVETGDRLAIGGSLGNLSEKFQCSASESANGANDRICDLVAKDGTYFLRVFGRKDKIRLIVLYEEGSADRNLYLGSIRIGVDPTDLQRMIPTLVDGDVGGTKSLIGRANGVLNYYILADCTPDSKVTRIVIADENAVKGSDPVAGDFFLGRCSH